MPVKFGFYRHLSCFDNELAGCRLQLSNRKPQNIGDNKELSNSDTKVEKSARFANDLLKINEFCSQFKREISNIID